MANPRIEVEIGAKINEFEKKFEKVDDQVNKTGKQFTKLNEFAVGALQGIAAAFTVGSIVNFGKAVIDATAQFQKFEAVLTNTLGSQLAAQVALDTISEFASKTPFSVEELTGSFVKLANQGFKPTVSELTKLGDLAASTGKSFDQLAEAIIDAQVGEFERLKEFGIRASKEGDNVTFTFKGVQTQVENTETAIQGYILSLGDLQGVSGSTAAISDTVGGKISNLGDNITQLQVAIGDSSSGLIAGVLDLANALISNLANSFNAVNTIAKKTGENGFVSFGKQLLALVNPNYAIGLQLQAQALKEYDKGLLEASESAKKANKEVKELTDDEKLKLYQEALKKFNKQWDDYNLGLETTKILNDSVGKSFDSLDEKINSLSKAIIDSKTSEEIEKIRKELDLIQEFEFELPENPPQQDDTPQEDKSKETEFIKSLSQLNKEFEKYAGDFNQRVVEFVSGIKNTIQQNMYEAFIGVGEAIGSALTKGENILAAVGQSLLDTLSTFLGDLGRQLIAFGVAGTAFGALLEAIKKGGPASIPAGIAAIAAGTALVAISSAIRNRAASGPSGGGGVGTSGVGSGTSFTGGGLGFAFDASREIRGELVARGSDLVYVFNEANNRINKG